MTVNSRTLLTVSAAATRAIGTRLGGLVRPGDVVVLTGDLGAGKTVVVQGVAESLRVSGAVTSPTFNILVVHRGDPVDLAHFDLYRLERVWELEDIDFWGVLESGCVSCIEWGDRFPEALPDDVLALSLRITGDESRTVAVTASGTRSEALASAWLDACAGVDGVTVVQGGDTP